MTLLQQQLPQIHPNVDVNAFDTAAAALQAKLPGLTAEQADVGFMELIASLGDRNGHTGIFPLDPGNARAFHEYPFLVYEFADGVYVTAQIGGHDLVGARLTAVGGTPIKHVLAQVKPLVPHDNETSGVKIFRPMYLLSKEVLGRTRDRAAVRILAPQREARRTHANGGERRRVLRRLRRVWLADVAERRSARRRSARCDARLAARAWARRLPRVQRRRRSTRWPIAARLARLASTPAVRRVVVDLRNNLGGDNNTYPPLIDELQRLARHHKQIVVLAGRYTFSAAANFMGDLEAATRYLLVGEDSGGAPNLYGDVRPLDLPATGLRVEVATRWWVKSIRGADDPRVTFHPDVVVPPLQGRGSRVATRRSSRRSMRRSRRLTACTERLRWLPWPRSCQRSSSCVVSSTRSARSTGSAPTSCSRSTAR